MSATYPDERWMLKAMFNEVIAAVLRQRFTSAVVENPAALHLDKTVL